MSLASLQSVWVSPSRAPRRIAPTAAAGWSLRDDGVDADLGLEADAQCARRSAARVDRVSRLLAIEHGANVLAASAGCRRSAQYTSTQKRCATSSNSDGAEVLPAREMRGVECRGGIEHGARG